MARQNRVGPLRCAWLGVVCLLISGCSKAPRGKVEGAVYCHGQPLANVLVTFVPEDAASDARRKRAFGVTDAEGRYRLQGEDKQPGAVAGPYRVIVEDLAVYAAPRDADGTILEMPPLRFPRRFSDPLQSPILKEVMAGKQVIDLELPNAP